MDDPHYAALIHVPSEIRLKNGRPHGEDKLVRMDLDLLHDERHVRPHAGLHGLQFRQRRRKKHEEISGDGWRWHHGDEAVPGPCWGGVHPEDIDDAEDGEAVIYHVALLLAMEERLGDRQLPTPAFTCCCRQSGEGVGVRASPYCGRPPVKRVVDPQAGHGSGGVLAADQLEGDGR